jgi:hypothetical protein
MKEMMPFFITFLTLFSLCRGEYVRVDFAHLHRYPLVASDSLTTLTCGQKVKPVPAKKTGEKKVFQELWLEVKIGPLAGHMQKDHLSAGKPECWQDQYPKLFQFLELSITDIFYWGRLFDLKGSGFSKEKIGGTP